MKLWRYVRWNCDVIVNDITRSLLWRHCWWHCEAGDIVTMLLKEYRICMPLTVDEVRILSALESFIYDLLLLYKYLFLFPYKLTSVCYCAKLKSKDLTSIIIASSMVYGSFIHLFNRESHFFSKFSKNRSFQFTIDDWFSFRKLSHLSFTFWKAVNDKWLFKSK